ncbi:hypothetical protein DLAC_01522 [Tieghemostelium lacteum]|uniref:Transmembrane protein n=1 Tax=Tieghemostelium lacteum TaxID=361077 RepID=A0A152A5M8_TIELA|nr:hypothetical protein DLAC_01522 [Tieghemostelium lacteum]|eukprot:KYR01528.1 hypothetical protein DLAC_01522 [Tieghemostelium lacteum]
MSIYSQQVILNGDLNGTTTFTFTNTSKTVLVINEPDYSQFTITRFTMSNIIISNLQAPFLIVNSNQTMVNVNIDNCNFQNITLPQSLFTLNSESVPIQFEVTNTTYSNSTSSFYTGFNINLKLLNSNFLDNQLNQNQSLIISNSDNIDINNCQFLYNRISSHLIDIRQSNQIRVNTSIFSQNILLNNHSSDKMYNSLMSIESQQIFIESVQLNMNINISGIWLFSNSVAQLTNLQYSSNQVDNQSTLLWCGQNSIVNLTSTIFSNNWSYIGPLITTFNSSLSLESCQFSDNIGNISEIDSSDVTFSQITLNSNTNFHLFTCFNSSIQFQDTTSININSLIQQSQVTCLDNSCQINGIYSNSANCLLTQTPTPTPSITNNSKTKSARIALIVILSVSSAALIIGIISYYFIIYRKQHALQSYDKLTSNYPLL